MIFRLSSQVVGGVLIVCQAWMPTNHLLRWIYTDRGLKWGAPIAVVLVPIYYKLGNLFQMQIGDGGSNWWWLAVGWAVVNCLKFLSVGIRTPFVWAYRAARRTLSRADMEAGRVPDSPRTV